MKLRLLERLATGFVHRWWSEGFLQLTNADSLCSAKVQSVVDCLGFHEGIGLSLLRIKGAPVVY